MAKMHSYSENENWNVETRFTLFQLFQAEIDRRYETYCNAKKTVNKVTQQLIKRKTELTTAYAKKKWDADKNIARKLYVIQRELWKTAADAARMSKIRYKAAQHAFDTFRRKNPQIDTKESLVSY